MAKLPTLSNAERQAIWRARQAAARAIDLGEVGALAELLDSVAVAGILIEMFGGIGGIVAAEPAAIIAAIPHDADQVALLSIGRKLAALRTILARSGHG